MFCGVVRGVVFGLRSVPPLASSLIGTEPGIEFKLYERPARFDRGQPWASYGLMQHVAQFGVWKKVRTPHVHIHFRVLGATMFSYALSGYYVWARYAANRVAVLRRWRRLKERAPRAPRAAHAGPSRSEHELSPWAQSARLWYYLARRICG